jgi:hypothetical protein
MRKELPPVATQITECDCVAPLPKKPTSATQKESGLGSVSKVDA